MGISLLDFVRDTLRSEDQVKKNYRALYNAKEGFLILSNKKLLFIEERGFFRRSYNVILEMPYEKIEKMDVVASHRLELTDTDRKTYTIASFGEVTASTLEEDLKTLIFS